MTPSRATLRSRIRELRLLLLDVDGVLTDGRIYYASNDLELKSFHVHDGLGIQLLQEAGITVGFLSSRRSPSVTRRARELGVDLVRMGVPDKLHAYEKIRRTLRLNHAQVGYVGDDLPDLPVLGRVGFPVAVKGSPPEVARAARYLTRRRGGDGAVREIATLILAHRPSPRGTPARRKPRRKKNP